MIPLLLSLAVAGEPVSTEPARYPVRAVYDSSVEVRCPATVLVDERGKPSKITVDSCAPYGESVFLKRAERALRSWRWAKDAPGATAVEVVFVPPVDALVPADPLTWRRRWDGSCQALVAVSPDGTPRIRRADEGCAPVLSPIDATPPRWVAKRAPKLCIVTFQASAGQARNIETFRCDLRMQRHVRDAVDAWSWSGEGVRAYTVVLQLDGDRSSPLQRVGE